jgi:hypothetical protein
VVVEAAAVELPVDVVEAALVEPPAVPEVAAVELLAAEPVELPAVPVVAAVELLAVKLAIAVPEVAAVELLDAEPIELPAVPELDPWELANALEELLTPLELGVGDVEQAIDREKRSGRRVRLIHRRVPQLLTCRNESYVSQGASIGRAAVGYDDRNAREQCPHVPVAPGLKPILLPSQLGPFRHSSTSATSSPD